MIYNPKKAEVYNKLRQQGLTEDQAASQAGITTAEATNYVIGNNGQMGPAIIGGGKVAGVDYDKLTPAELAEQARFEQGLQPVGYPEIANSAPSLVTYNSYTTNSTETISGGGSTTVTIPPTQPTAASQAFNPLIAAKRDEISQFNSDNPSNFVRSRKGLPLLSPEESLARQQQLDRLSAERSVLVNQQLTAETRPPVTTTIVPNTTTTTNTVTVVTAPTNQLVDPVTDLNLQQQTELQGGVAATVTGGVNFAPGDVPSAEILTDDLPELPEAFEPGDVPSAEILTDDLPEVPEIFEPGDVPSAEILTDDLPELSAADIEDAEQGAAMRAAISNAQQQATIQQRFNQTTEADWRVRIRLAPNANYLYKAQSPGILAPLVASDGVIFPYVPTIATSYQASYARKDLTHSNYRGYFYQSSAVNDIAINGTFTAQDTTEAQYMLAVIHFFRSATKMFYGKDEFRGAPPPLLELSGFGAYQFNNHPCLISNFSYNLPNGVDYIRVNPSAQGQNLVVNRNQVSSSPISTIETTLNRISSLIDIVTGKSVAPGAKSGSTDLGFVGQTVSGTTQTTYVPTKIEIQINLLPVQTRSQVSQQFSLKKFASGDLLRGGFW